MGYSSDHTLSCILILGFYWLTTYFLCWNMKLNSDYTVFKFNNGSYNPVFAELYQKIYMFLTTILLIVRTQTVFI
jgi:hypothetical protein